MNFDRINDRKHTHSVKWDGHKTFKVNEEAFPMWVADMDFQTDKKVIEALMKEAQSGIFGYRLVSDSYLESVASWLNRRFDWTIDKEWIVDTPGVVSAFHAALSAFTHEKDAVLIMQPVYHPFRKGILQLKRKVVNQPLTYDEHSRSYWLDMHALEQSIVTHQVKMMVLCSPHNPVGKVWTKDELVSMAEICLKHQVLIFSDEIHMDIVHSQGKHIPLASLDQRYHPFVLTAIAASKTFNLAGLKLSQVIVPDETLRRKIQKPYQTLGVSAGNSFAYLATEMAYTHGDEYVNQLNAYLEQSIAYIDDFLQKHLPMIIRVPSQSLYLVWLDFRQLNLDDKQLQDFLRNQAKLWFNDGHIFGTEGSGFQRMNIATPKENIIKALNQLKEAIEKLKSIE